MFRHSFNQIRTKCSIQEPTKFMRNSFRKAFGKYLVATNIVSSGVLLGFADLVQQEIEYRQQKISKRYDFKRLGNIILNYAILASIIFNCRKFYILPPYFCLIVFLICSPIAQ